jgi:hypothetical protein
MQNKAYKKWLLQEGKHAAGVVRQLAKDLNGNNKQAHAIMKEAGASYDMEGLKKAVQLIIKQCKKDGHQQSA